MMVEASIPRHITGIYVFAVVNLLALLCISGADADIIVKNLTSNETIHFDDLQAGFGPDFPDDGIEGYIVYANPPDACSKVTPPPSHLENYKWILLIARGGSCQFADKVVAAQNSFYDSAIVYNYPANETLQPMGAGRNGSHVRIPSTFVGWSTGHELKTKYNYSNPQVIIKIIEDGSLDLRVYLWPFAIVVAVCFLMIMVFLLVKFLRDHAQRRVSRLSKKHLKKIPVRKFKKGDYYDTCAICLDEYEEGEKIRVLPCDHVYHTKCIDPWLTKNKKTCPVCKRRVMPGKDADSESGSDSDDGGSTAVSGSENTPLLSDSRPSYTNRPRGSLRIVGNDTSSTGSQAENEATEGIGTAVLTTLDEYGAIYPSDSDTEHGAVGGLGISDRRSQRQRPSTSVTVSNHGNIQGDAEEVAAQGEPKRKSHKRERKARQDREEEEEAQEEDELAPLVTETREERRERRKKKKEKKRRSERSTKSQEGESSQARNPTEEEESSTGAVGQENQVEDFDTTTSTLKALENEEKAEGGNENPSSQGVQEVTVPRRGRRREMNELV